MILSALMVPGAQLTQEAEHVLSLEEPLKFLLTDDVDESQLITKINDLVLNLIVD